MTEHDLTESQLVGSRIRDARIKRRMAVPGVQRLRI